MRKIIILNAFLFAQIMNSQQDPSSQNMNSMSNTASPNAAGFMRFQESPINHYNGRGNFSIPIYEINVGGIKYPISLNYSHGGIQVNSIASDVGLGWSLTSTFVNRTVVGDADLETINDTRQYNQKQKYGYFDYMRIWGNNGYSPYAIVDYFPDMFKFVSPTNSSSFYFNDVSQVVELDQKESRIDAGMGSFAYNYIKDNYTGEWVNSSISVLDYAGFNITTKDGLYYSFEGNNDITHSFTDGYEYYTHNFGGINGTYPRVSTWNVSKIKNLNNQEEINFIYDTYSSETTDYIDDILNNHPYIGYESICPSATVEPYVNNLHYGIGRCNNGGISRYYNRMLKIQRIKEITFRGGSVEFNYAKPRNDLPNGKALTGIIIKDSNGKTVKEYELEYDYFYSSPSYNSNDPGGYYGLRLKLNSVREKGYNKYQFNYYEEDRLPVIGSSLQDIFGYNNFPPLGNQHPELYYYPNKYEYSILPYAIQGQNYYPLSTGFYKEPNDQSKIWSLKKVIFPTGGSNTFILESNTFNLWGNNLKGGGTRLQQQIIQESEGGQQRIINYTYNKNANTSSGYLFNMPQIGYPTSVLTQNELTKPWLKSYFLYYSNAKVNYDLLNNFFIGYSKVEENENGIKTIYDFINDEEPNIQTRSNTQSVIGQFLISNSSYGNNFYVDNSHKRGKLKYITYYDKYNLNPIMLKEFMYKGYVGVETENFPNRHYAYAPAISYDDYDLMQLKKSYNTIYNNLVYTKTTKYLPSGNVEDESHMYYDNNNQNLVGVAHKIENGTAYPIFDVKKYFYPTDLRNGTPNTATLDERVQADHLLEVNKDDLPMLTQTYSAEINPATLAYIAPWNMISQSKIAFAKDSNTNNMILPVQALKAIGQNPFYEVGKFDRYDSKGNLLQSTNDGLSTTYIYGYNQLYPIAKIEGATYDQVMIALGVTNPTSSSYLSLDIVTKSNADINEATESYLITSLDTFRKNANLANFKTTTYTYNPLIGLTSVTPPSGMRDIYIYETVTNKLKEVKRMEKDAGGNNVYRTLKEYEYHYKP